MEIQDTDIKTGNVIYAFPSFGWAWVRPSGSTNLVLTLFCRLPYQGGITGGCIIAAPTPGSTVQYRRLGNSRRGYIVAVVSQGSEHRGFYQVSTLCTYGKSIFNSASKLVEQVIGFLRNEHLGVGEQAAMSGLEDQQPGDVYIGDRYGPGMLFGRGQLTIKGSDLSYLQFDALQDKITTLTVKSDVLTLSSQEVKNTDLDKYLKASGSFLGLGGISGKDKEIFKVLGEGETVSYAVKDRDPLYRVQKFSGGAVQGDCCSIAAPVTSEKERPSLLAFAKDDYDGTSLRIGQGFTSIKTLRTSGVSEYPFPEDAELEDIKKEKEKRKEALNKIIELYKDFKLSDNGIERVLQIAQLLDDRDVIGLLLKDIRDGASAILNGVDLATEAYNNKVRLNNNIPKVGTQLISDYPSSTVTDTLTGKTITRFDNTSIISQDPDGSVTIKDGWGSQITMSHGNIYISSALDTFIRPGRDLITMVPRHLSQTANGLMELAAKENVKIGAEKNLVLASALNGQPGYTVLENRTTVDDKTGSTGIVIRSNGNLSMTSSQDMHIGINDKRKVNNKDSGIVTGTGSVYIEGNKVRIDSSEEFRLSGSRLGIYAYQDDKGTGLLLSPVSVTAIGDSISLMSSNIQMGRSITEYTVKLGISGKTDVTLLQGKSKLNLQIRGNLLCLGSMTVHGGIRAAGDILALDYRVATEKNMEEIKGMGDGAKEFYKNIAKSFLTPLKGTSIGPSFVPVLQPWYNDDFICKKELSFFDSWTVTVMPQMSWQVLSFSNRLLQPITVIPTGADQEERTCAYPGNKAWGDDKEACKMLTVDPALNVIRADSDKAPLLKNAYKTNAER